MNNDKRIYRLLNQIKLDTSKYEETTLPEEEKDELFDSVKHRLDHSSTDQPKTSSWKRPVLLVAAALFLAFLGLQTPLGQRVQAATFSFLESFRYTITDALGVEERTTDDTSISVDQVQTIGDAEVKVEDMVIFNDLLLINILVDLGDLSDDLHFTMLENRTLFLNDKEITDSLLVYGGPVSEEANIHNGILAINLNEEPLLTDNINIDLTLENLLIDDKENIGEATKQLPTIVGEAVFSIDTTKDELLNNSNKYPIDQSVSTDLYDYSINNLNVNPLMSFIDVTSDNWTDTPFEVIEMRGEDEQGNKIVFTQDSIMTNDESSYLGSFTFSEEDSEITSEQMLESEELNLQLYSVKFSEDMGIQDFTSYGEPFTIKFNQ